MLALTLSTDDIFYTILVRQRQLNQPLKNWKTSDDKSDDIVYQISDSGRVFEPLLSSSGPDVRIVSFVVDEESFVQKLAGGLSDGAMRRVDQLVHALAILKINLCYKFPRIPENDESILRILRLSLPMLLSSIIDLYLVGEHISMVSENGDDQTNGLDGDLELFVQRHCDDTILKTRNIWLFERKKILKETLVEKNQI